MKPPKIKVTTLVAVFAGWFICFSLAQAAVCQMSVDSEPAATGAFKAKLRASGLEKKHSYQLTINGYKGHPSNEILKTYQNYQDEGYIDFKKVPTDANGVLTTAIDRKLPKSKYRVKLLIKDPDNNFLVVCSEDLVEFEVK